MSKIFVSHSSKNNREASAIRDWLLEEGWGEIFLDFDSERGLRAGSQWNSELTAAVQRSEAVLVLISPEWVASEWCKIEYYLASSHQKPVIACIVRSMRIDDIPAHLRVQHVIDITKLPTDISDGVTGWRALFSETEIKKLKFALDYVGIEATHFDWPPPTDVDRTPYPGLSAYREDEAGIYFGRDGAVVSSLGIIRAVKGQGEHRVLPILGASGAGKSSFIRAGLLPRLKRDRQNFCVLPVLRPANAALTGETGLVEVLALALKAIGRPRGRSDIRDAVFNGDTQVREILAELAAHDGLGDLHRSVVLTVDQAEELLAPEGSEASRFLELLRNLLDVNISGNRPQLIVLMTIRTDSFDRLQSLPQLSSFRTDPISLGTMPTGEYGNVIRGPARRQIQSGKKLDVDERLVSTLLEDLQTGGAKDSLPLLSFTLERLYREFGDSGALTKDQYLRLGGIRGSINAAIERVLSVAHGREGIPNDRTGKLVLLRRGLIPWLAVIDADTNSPRRRIARLSEIPEESRALIKIMVEERLLSTDIDPNTGERTIEPAHEALLRQWGDLDVWLQESLGDYSAIQGVKRNARDWAASGKDAGWLVHRGGRLEDANKTRAKENFARLLEPTDEQYLDLCQMAEDYERALKVRGLRRTLAGTCAALVATLVLLAVAGFWYIEAEASANQALASLDLSNSSIALRDGDLGAAATLAASAYNRSPNSDARSQLLSIGKRISPYLSHVYRFGEKTPVALAWKPDGTLLAVMRTGELQPVKVDGRKRQAHSVLPTLEPRDGTRSLPIALIASDREVITIFRDGQVTSSVEGSVSDSGVLFPAAIIQGRGDLVSTTKTGSRAVAVANDEIILWDCDIANVGLEKCLSRRLPLSGVSAVTISHDGGTLFAGAKEDVLLRVSVTGGTTEKVAELSAPVISLALSRDSALLASSHPNGAIEVRNTKKLGNIVSTSTSRLPGGSTLAWSPTSDDLAYTCDLNQICVVAIDGERRSEQNRVILSGHRAPVVRMTWSPDGKSLASLSSDGELRVWTVKNGSGPLYSLLTSSEPLTSLGIDPGTGRIVVGNDAGKIFSGDVNRLEAVRTPSQARTRISEVRFSENGQVAALVENAGMLVEKLPGGEFSFFPVLDNADLQQLAWVGKDLAVMAVRNEDVDILSGNDGAVLSSLGGDKVGATPWGAVATYSGDGLYVSYTNGSVQKWLIPQGKLEAPIVPPITELDSQLGVSSLALAKDGDLLALTSGEGNVVIVSLVDKRHVLNAPTNDMTPKTLKFSPSGTKLVALSSNGWLYLWKRGSTWELEFQIKWQDTLTTAVGPMENPSDIAWVTDGRIALTTSSGAVQIMDLDEEAWIAKFKSTFGDVADN
jgi:WD40 repeat protein